MYRVIKASTDTKYQCYYNETIFVEQPGGSSRKYIGKKVLTDCFDTEAEAERYCRTHVGSQKVGDEYIENEMNYEEVEASTAVKASTEDKLVNLLAKTEDGWKYVFKGIKESQAQAIWEAGFKTGQNNFSIETDEDKRIREMNKKKLRGEK